MNKNLGQFLAGFLALVVIAGVSVIAPVHKTSPHMSLKDISTDKATVFPYVAEKAGATRGSWFVEQVTATGQHNESDYLKSVASNL